MAYGYISRNTQRRPYPSSPLIPCPKLSNTTNADADGQRRAMLAASRYLAARIMTKTTRIIASKTNDNTLALMRATGYTPRMSASCTRK